MYIILNCEFVLNLGIGFMLSSSIRHSPIRLWLFLEMPGYFGRINGFTRHLNFSLESKEGASNH